MEEASSVGKGARDSSAGKSLADLRDEMLRDDPELLAAWEALEPKRRIVTALLRLRAAANLTQKELAERAGWSTAFVSRLETFPGEGQRIRMPDLFTIAAYAAACGYQAGVVFGRPKGRSGTEIVAAAAPHASDRFHRKIQTLTGTCIEAARGSGRASRTSDDG